MSNSINIKQQRKHLKNASWKPSQKDPKSSSNRSLVNKFFITFPNSGLVTKQKLELWLTSKYTVKRYIIAEEVHKSGEPHLHAAIDLSAKISQSRLLLAFQLQYPDAAFRIQVQSMNSWEGSVTYLTNPTKDKEVDNNPLVFGFDLDVTTQFHSESATVESLFKDVYYSLMEDRGAQEVLKNKLINLYDSRYTPTWRQESDFTEPISIGSTSTSRVRFTAL